MDGVANVVRQQQSQAKSHEAQGRVSQVEKQKQPLKMDVVKQMQENSSKVTHKITNKEEVQELVNKLNEALAPMSTSLKFGFDNTEDVFYVSVLESETSKMIRRFPAEQAMEFLPKMQEVTGILFDSKG